MWAITSYFNPTRSQRRLANYRSFRADLSVPLVAVELCFNGEFELTKHDADVLIQIHGGAVLWQKERLLNLAMKSVPSDAAQIAWIDCDIIFGRADWAQEAEAQLRINPLVQLFSELLDLPAGEFNIRDEHVTLSPSARGIVALNEAGDGAFIVPQRDPNVRPVLRGLAWAARTELIKEHGFYDACILGSGDRAMAYASFGRFDEVMRSMLMNQNQQTHYLKWAVPFYHEVKGRIGYVPGRIYHLWHGHIEHRRYDERHKILPDYNFDPHKDIVISPNGAWAWACQRRELSEVLVRYFESRDEERSKAPRLSADGTSSII
jgi:hypothetical protein